MSKKEKLTYISANQKNALEPERRFTLVGNVNGR